MRHGDRVTGVPAHPDLRAEHPTVTGRYDSADWEFLGEHHVTEFVAIGDVLIDCTEIRLARDDEPDTVLND